MFKMMSAFVVIFLLLATPLIITDGVSETTKVTLKKGWNMISSPIKEPIPTTTITTACTLGESGASNAIWYWDSTLTTAKSNWKKHTEAFEGNPKIDSIESGKGYWVYVKEDCQFDATGSVKPNSATISLLEGWNMISSPIASPIPVTLITSKCTLGESGASNAIWYWDSTLTTAKSNWKKHTEAFEGNPKIDSIESGKGYWVYVKEPCSFTATAGSDGVPPAPPGGTPSTCHGSCAAAGDMGSLTTTTGQQTCEIPKGGSDFYSFMPTVNGKVKITAEPSTNNDIDLFAYNDKACGVDKMICASTGSGRSAESCSFDATASKAYYIKTSSYDYAGYDEKAKAKITLELTGAPPAGINLKPYQPQGWGAALVVSHDKSATTSTALQTGKPLYINVAWQNDGAVDAGPFASILYLDNVLFTSWYTAKLEAGKNEQWTDQLSGIVSTAGTHTLKLAVDFGDFVNESNEKDNILKKNFTFESPASCSFNSCELAGDFGEIKGDVGGGTILKQTCKMSENENQFYKFKYSFSGKVGIFAYDVGDALTKMDVYESGASVCTTPICSATGEGITWAQCMITPTTGKDYFIKVTSGSKEKSSINVDLITYPA